MPPKPLDDLLLELRDDRTEGTLRNVMDGIKEHDNAQLRAVVAEVEPKLRQGPRGEEERAEYIAPLLDQVENALQLAIIPDEEWAARMNQGGRRRSQAKRFGSCVKAVRKTVKARKGSSKESAAIAICTKTILHPRGRTLKRYRKGRLLTQKRRA